MTRPTQVFFILVPLYEQGFNVSPMMVERHDMHHMTDRDGAAMRPAESADPILHKFGACVNL